MILGGATWKRQFRATIAGLADGSIRIGLGTLQAFGTGKDVPAIAQVFVTTPIANNKQQMAQVKGRACRLGKESARLYYFWDRKVSGKKAIENLAKWNRKAVVWSGGEWVEARAHLRAMKAGSAEP